MDFMKDGSQVVEKVRKISFGGTFVIDRLYKKFKHPTYIREVNILPFFGKCFSEWGQLF